MRTGKLTTFSLQIKLTGAFILLSAFTAAALFSILYFNFRNQIRENLREELSTLVSVAALEIDGDLHAQLTKPEDWQKDAYREVSDDLVKVQSVEKDIYYIYTIQRSGARAGGDLECGSRCQPTGGTDRGSSRTDEWIVQ
jgi:hypothetical protein